VALRVALRLPAAVAVAVAVPVAVPVVVPVAAARRARAAGGLLLARCLARRFGLRFLGLGPQCSRGAGWLGPMRSDGRRFWANVPPRHHLGGGGRVEEAVRHLLQHWRQSARRGGPAQRGHESERASRNEHRDAVGERVPCFPRAGPDPRRRAQRRPADGEFERRHGGLLAGKFSKRGRTRGRGEHEGQRLVLPRGIGTRALAGQQPFGCRLVGEAPIVVAGRNRHLSRGTVEGRHRVTPPCPGVPPR